MSVEWLQLTTTVEAQMPMLTVVADEDKDENEVQWSEERFCGDTCGFCDKPIYRKQEN